MMTVRIDALINGKHDVTIYKDGEHVIKYTVDVLYGSINKNEELRIYGND